ncbi:MAG: hypothetical protein ACRDHZ_01725 [Ktedonobacteraceae bacterium]
MENLEQDPKAKALKLLEEYRANKTSMPIDSSMVMQWGKARLLEARPEIEPLLQSSDISLRISALDALACRSCLQDYWSTAVQFLLYDTDYLARTKGASALAWLQNHTGDRQTLGVLASVVVDRYDYELVRDDAYRSMRIVAFGEWQPLNEQSSEGSFELERDADWSFVNSSINPVLEEIERVEAQALLEQHRAGKVAERDYYTMLRKFGRAKLQEARNEVEEFLSSTTLLLRKTALQVLLLYFQIPGNWQLAVDMFQHDPDKNNRLAALEVLGQLMRGTGDKATLRILYPLTYDNDWGENVFPVILQIYAGDFGEIKAYLASPEDDPRL